MQDEKNHWPPVVGDEVWIKDSRLTGSVTKTKGASETRFQIKVSSVTGDGERLKPGPARAARLASRWYGLDELAPVPKA
jgi:hypothetical protein